MQNIALEIQRGVCDNITGDVAYVIFFCFFRVTHIKCVAARVLALKSDFILEAGAVCVDMVEFCIHR